MSKNVEQRLRSYGKDRKVHRLTEVPDCVSTEKKLISLFSEKFEVFRGKETFKGELDKMLKIFDQVCSPKKERQRKRYLPNRRSTWMEEGTDKKPGLGRVTRRRLAHIDLREFPLHLECHIKGNEKVVVIADSADNVQIHRIGELCFLKSDTLGMAVRGINPTLGTIIDLGYVDVHFVVLEKNLPGDWVLCNAESWEQCIAFRSKYIPADKGDFLSPSLSQNPWRDAERFGNDEGMDEELRKMMRNSSISYDHETREMVSKYLLNDLEVCCSIWTWIGKFSMKIFTRNRSKKEFVRSPREPLSSIERALHVINIQQIISETAKPSKNFQYGVEIFGIDLEILPETEEQLKSYTKWGKSFGGDDGSDNESDDGSDGYHERGIPEFIVSTRVYALFSWRYDLEENGTPGSPIKFCGEPNPWSLEKTKKSSDIHNINHSFPGFLATAGYYTIFVDIVIHCKDGPIYIVLFDPRKRNPIAGEYKLPQVKNFAKAVHFVDVTRISSEYLCSVFRGETSV
ncbi:hypothetical protein MarSH_037 [Marseillevirus Shanghai 1]|nr:hypothetical protein MarSH_037 [Marseillevirus Shanghai 1]